MEWLAEGGTQTLLYVQAQYKSMGMNNKIIRVHIKNGGLPKMCHSFESAVQKWKISCIGWGFAFKILS